MTKLCLNIAAFKQSQKWIPVGCRFFSQCVVFVDEWRSLCFFCALNCKDLMQMCCITTAIAEICCKQVAACHVYISWITHNETTTTQPFYTPFPGPKLSQKSFIAKISHVWKLFWHQRCVETSANQLLKMELLTINIYRSVKVFNDKLINYSCKFSFLRKINPAKSLSDKNLKRLLLDWVLQCLDTVGWAAGRASGL